jgi:hypothetical protein
MQSVFSSVQSVQSVSKVVNGLHRAAATISGRGEGCETSTALEIQKKRMERIERKGKPLPISAHRSNRFIGLIAAQRSRQ